MSDFKDLQLRAVEVRQKYAEYNKKNGNDKWGGKELAMGFVGDVGDLVKLVMAKENLRKIDDADIKMAHELSDCLWSLLVIADKYNVDLDTSFHKTMRELEQRIAS
ncbi:hypothetical protein A3D14_01375 [Candidatus Saccharibacteria bacterium RIFCSPHIGHO2_02_FULL_47_12]|nr:MAG: hypothetical protein A3D14_01375 [Candidatus Saccharibacteria bacterium RIFCSPHIGHO2_02_FULL_47_12]